MSITVDKFKLCIVNPANCPISWQAKYAGCFFYLLFSTACTATRPAQPTPTLIDRLAIDPVFRELYRHLGGEDVLGPPISPVFNAGTARTQYVQKAKMVFDPSSPIRQRFTLAPLGVEMGVIEPPVKPPEQAGFAYDGGHVIAPEFLPLYEKLGAYIVGKPLTELRYNPIRRRHEQFFESVGFYRLEGSDQVRLLDYGIWACNENCRQYVTASDSPDATMDLIARIDPAFVQFVNQWGLTLPFYLRTLREQNGKWSRSSKCSSEADAVIGQHPPATLNQLRIPPDPPPASQQLDRYLLRRKGRDYEVSYPWEYPNAWLRWWCTDYTCSRYMGRTASCFVNLCLMYDQQALSTDLSRLVICTRLHIISQTMRLTAGNRCLTSHLGALSVCNSWSGTGSGGDRNAR
jgi:hypothetical protein